MSIVLELFAKGRYAVRRKDGELPFALLLSPSASGKGIRRWGVVYRDAEASHPLGGDVNISFPVKADAIRDLETTARVCSEYQLGIETSPGDRLEYLRGEIEAERISYDEISELQSLGDCIDSDDTLLREWAGLPEIA